MEGSSVKAYGADGVEAASADVQSGEVLEFVLEDGEFKMDDGHTTIRVPATHSLENVGESEYRELMIEFK